MLSGLVLILAALAALPANAARSSDAETLLEQALELDRRGEHALARHACDRLLGRETALIVATCRSHLPDETTTGREHYRRLLQVYRASPEAGDGARRWALATLARLALQIGEHGLAREHYRQALAAGTTPAGTAWQLPDQRDRASALLDEFAAASGRSALQTSRSWRWFWRSGVEHILDGYDHLLFLLTLLLPIPLHPAGGARSLPRALLLAAVVVTAFTLAHSLSLIVAVLGGLRPPPYWIETAIAASVLLAALHNAYPLLRGRLWLLALPLGLIHGFGFASAVAALPIAHGEPLYDLLAFNLGVETGQLAVVGAALPPAFWLAKRAPRGYRIALLGGGSLLAATASLFWLLQLNIA